MRCREGGDKLRAGAGDGARPRLGGTMPVRRRRTLPVSAFKTRLTAALFLTISTSLAAGAAPESGISAVPERVQPAPSSASSPPAATPDAVVRRARFGEVAPGRLPADMTDPESRTRWDLSAVRTVTPWTIETRQGS